MHRHYKSGEETLLSMWQTDSSTNKPSNTGRIVTEQHTAALQQWVQNLRAPVRMHQHQLGPVKTRVIAHKNYVRQQTKDGGASLADLGVAWRLLSPEEQYAYRITEQRLSLAAPPMMQAMPKDATPLRLGNHLCPIDEDIAHDIADEVETMSRQFVELCGHVCDEMPDLKENSESVSCCRKYLACRALHESNDVGLLF